MGAMVWVDIIAPGGAYTSPILSAFYRHLETRPPGWAAAGAADARAPADDEAAPADPLGVRG
eukprot:327387-Pyramimonas_sp.AAC.1